MSRVAGVDLGKTGCRAQLVGGGPEGPVVEGPGAPGLAEPGGVDRTLDAIRQVLGPEPVATICVGAAGAHAAPQEARRLAECLLVELSPQSVAVTSDAVTAHAGALGGGPGSVLAVGTGAVALSVGVDGSCHQIDGWGPWLGDDGSGAWIGRAALRSVLRAHEGRSGPTSLTAMVHERFGPIDQLPLTLATGDVARTAAAVVPEVLAAAAAGDEVAQTILDEAVGHWAEIAAAAVIAAACPDLAVVGGLAQAQVLVDGLRDRLPEGVALRPARGSSLDGAVLLARSADLAHESSVVRLVAGSVAPSRATGVSSSTDVDVLDTEQVRFDLLELDEGGPEDVVAALLEAEATVPAALDATRAELVEAVRLASSALARGGRLVYVGAGTPGRLAALDAAECGPTFGIDPDRVVAVLAGGQHAERTAVEGAEDDAISGAVDLRALAVGPRDVIVGITASGRTPYVLAALEAAREAGSCTVAVVNNPDSPAAALAEVAVEALTGPEVLAGSTRLKAGTAQKVALNIISTAAMVAHGRTYGAWMVDVVASNEKLRRRSRRILREAAGVEDDVAVAALEESGWHTKTALVALLAHVPADQARLLLDEHGGHARSALAAARVQLP